MCGYGLADIISQLMTALEPVVGKYTFQLNDWSEYNSALFQKPKMVRFGDAAACQQIWPIDNIYSTTDDHKISSTGENIHFADFQIVQEFGC